MAYSNFYARFYSLINKIKSAFGDIFRFKSSFVYLGLVVFWQLVAWFQAWYIKSNLSGDVLVLHYNIDFGIDLVDIPSKIYLYPLLGLLIFIFNIILLVFFHKNSSFRIISNLLLGSAALFAIFLTIVLTSVYLINFL